MVKAVKPPMPATLLPWQLPIEKLESADIVAVQSLSQGTADSHQQRRAWDFIRNRLCQCDGMSFWPGGEDGKRATDFAEGKRFVGEQLRRISRMKPSRIDPRGEPPAMPGDNSEGGK